MKYFGIFEGSVGGLGHLKIGELGEARAVKMLRRGGGRVMSRNWRHGRDELDVVMREGDVLVFVEVKSTASDGDVPVYYRVGKDKKRNLERAAKAYMKKLPVRPRHFRFDVVEVYFNNVGKSVVKHHRNVALFSKHFH